MIFRSKIPPCVNMVWSSSWESSPQQHTWSHHHSLYFEDHMPLIAFNAFLVFNGREEVNPLTSFSLGVEMRKVQKNAHFWGVFSTIHQTHQEPHISQPHTVRAGNFHQVVTFLSGSDRSITFVSFESNCFTTGKPKWTYSSHAEWWQMWTLSLNDLL